MMIRKRQKNQYATVNKTKMVAVMTLKTTAAMATDGNDGTLTVARTTENDDNTTNDKRQFYSSHDK
jgi:hypothetical protein